MCFKIFVQRKSREIDNRHGSILRSSSADTPSSSPSLKKKQLRRRSKSVIRIKQTPSYYFQGIEKLVAPVCVVCVCIFSTVRKAPLK